MHQPLQRSVSKGRTSGAQSVLEEFFAPADVRFDGSRPWDIQVHDRRFFDRVISGGSLGLGESYMDGWWDCPQMAECFRRILTAELDGRGIGRRRMLWHMLKAKLFNLQGRSRSLQVAEQHYDAGNDLYRLMLCPNMQYTCAYWRDATTLEQAQLNKLDLVCRKLKLQPGMEVLELGGGFGGLARHLASKYGCKVVSYNISSQQVEFARSFCEGLPVQVVHSDYRAATGSFDRVVSVGMFEHVGYRNYRAFMQLVRDRLRDDHGLALVHTIGKHINFLTNDPWVDRYVFPNCVTPSPELMARALTGVMVLEDWHNFARREYALTLEAWNANFVNAWPALKEKYGERFFRMWTYYLLTSVGLAWSGKSTLWQVVLSKNGLPDGYEAVR